MIEATLNERVQEAYFLSAQVSMDGKLVVTLKFVVTMAPTVA